MTLYKMYFINKVIYFYTNDIFWLGQLFIYAFKAHVNRSSTGQYWDRHMYTQTYHFDSTSITFLRRV